MCVLIFSTILSETFLILRRSERDMTKMFSVFHVKYHSFLSDLIKLGFLNRFPKKKKNILKYQISWKSVQ